MQQATSSKSVREFAAAHSISMPTVWRLIASGALVARKIGRRTIIEDERAFIASLSRAR
jgi:hypothetical protein